MGTSLLSVKFCMSLYQSLSFHDLLMCLAGVDHANFEVCSLFTIGLQSRDYCFGFLENEAEDREAKLSGENGT